MTADPPFTLKICGVRVQSQLPAMADAGVDAIGLNFFPGSRRFLDPTHQAASGLATAAASVGLATVGLFVDADVETILRVASDLGLDHVQLHGDESIAVVDTLLEHGHSVVRAVRLPAGRLHAGQIAAAVTPYRDRDVTLLLDADVGGGGGFGGTGQRLDWAAIGEWNHRDLNHRWVLAGGLTPSNVARAIEASGATSVDVASGVESAAGIKSMIKIESFATVVLEEIDAKTQRRGDARKRG